MSSAHHTTGAEEEFLRGGLGCYCSVLAAGRQFDVVGLMFSRETLCQLVETIQTLTSQDDVPATDVDTQGGDIDFIQVANCFKLFHRPFRFVTPRHLRLRPEGCP